MTKNRKEEKKIDKVDEAVDALDATYGPIVFKLGKDKGLVRERISSGSLAYDRALGGGFVRGSLNEIFGQESSGKTTICLHAICEHQKYGKVLFIDTEHSFDPSYAKALGVDVNELYVCQPSYSEQAFTVMETLVSTGQFSLVILDSVAGLSPKVEVEGDSGDSNMGVAARLNRQHIRKITSIAQKTKTTILYTNQITYKIGVNFGNPETTSGGTGFKFFCSTRTDLRRISTQKDSINKGAIRARAKVVKNKTYIPFQEAEFDIEFGRGVTREGELLDLCLEYGIILKSGAWFSFEEEKIGHGRVKAIEFLRENEEIKNKITTKLKES